VHVEIWSDIACPWCYVGKRRFERALADFPHRDEVRVTWRSFELDPSAPLERPGTRDEQLAGKYGMSLEQARAMHAQMTEMAAADGIGFRFDIARSGSTFDAHRLVHLAAAHALGDAMKERLMRAYQGEGELVGDRDTLRRLALEVGVPEDAVDELLAGDAYAADVRADEQTAAQLGINAVPFFVVDRALAVSGAQPVPVFAELLGRGYDALTATAAPH
jgi:predicted DsbA family dithiol-disulfide isomerase